MFETKKFSRENKISFNSFTSSLYPTELAENWNRIGMEG
jgi:hypothetical protein